MKKIVLLAVLGLFLQINGIALGYGIPYDTFKVADINGGVRKNNVTTATRVANVTPPVRTVTRCSSPVPYYADMYYPVVITTTSRHVKHRPRQNRVGNPLYKLDPDYQNYYY